jgi:hypothetical protein
LDTGQTAFNSSKSTSLFIPQVNILIWKITHSAIYTIIVNIHLKYETLYTEQTKSHFHHWTLHECLPDFESVYLKNHSLPEPGNCVQDEQSVDSWDDVFSYCSKTSLAWAVGSSDIQKFPQDIAYPIEGYKYFLFQVHFDNPNRVSSIFIHIYISAILICMHIFY